MSVATAVYNQSEALQSDERWMRRALELAGIARSKNEVPVGALVVCEDRIVGEGRNSPIELCDPSAHAEILALRAAALRAANYRMPDSTLYVTLEPCIMCAGAIVQARIKRVVFGAHDPRAGAAGGAFDLLEDARLNHQPTVHSGVLGELCGDLLREFFRERR